MRNKEEPSANSSRGNAPPPATQHLAAGLSGEPLRSVSRPRLTATARAEQPALSLFPIEKSLMEAVVDPANIERAWRQVKANRGAPGPDGVTITKFPEWFRSRWPQIQQQLLDGMYRPGPVRRKTIDKPDGSGQRLLAPFPASMAKRDRTPDPTSHRPSSDADLRPDVFGIEFRFSTSTLGSRSSQASATHDPTWLLLRRRH